MLARATRAPVQRQAAAHSTSVSRINIRQPARTQQIARAQGSNNPVEGAINWLTVALKNSPINEGKKALAKAQGAFTGIACCSTADLHADRLRACILASALLLPLPAIAAPKAHITLL